MHKLGWMVKMAAVPIHVSNPIHSVWLTILYYPCPFALLQNFIHSSFLGSNCFNMQDYLAANYCPTLNEDQQWCEEALSRYYVGALVTISFLFFFLVNKVDVFVSFDPYHLPVCRCRALLCGWSNPCLSDRRRL